MICPTRGELLCELTLPKFALVMLVWMPPKTTVKQATRFAESLLRGEPNREKIIATVLADRVRELV